MDLQIPTNPVESNEALASSRLEPMLIRLPPPLADQLRQLARTTRIRQSDYLREAVADLLAKYRHVQQGAAAAR
jgi:Arc/MetJ-type ribon-helix-helix transcriptional regulator